MEGGWWDLESWESPRKGEIIAGVGMIAFDNVDNCYYN